MSSINRLTLPIVLAAFAILAACASKPPAKGARLDAPTPLDQFQIKTHDAPDQVGLSIHAEGLSPAQRDALAAFAARWRTAGEGVITLKTPSDAPDAAAAKSFTLAAEANLAALGVPYDHISAVAYVQGAAPKALVQVSFETVVAEAPDCKSVKWESLSSTKDNKPYQKFGCTLMANMAAQLADPRDLKGETPLAPSDATRRAQILTNYRSGKATSSEKDAQANGAVSQSLGGQQ